MREFNQHSNRPNDRDSSTSRRTWERGEASSSSEQRDRARSSQSQTHPARWRSLLFSCIHPETWERGETSSNESPAEVEQRLQREQRERIEREKLPLISRVDILHNFQRKHMTKLKKIEGKVANLEALVKKLEESCNKQSNENNLSHLYDSFQDLDCISVAQVQYINDKEENLTWVENMKNIPQTDVQFRIRLREHRRLKMLESQEILQKNQLSEMKKQVKEIEKKLKNIGNNGQHQISELSQECIDQLSIMHQKIKDQENIMFQRSSKINTLEKEGDGKRLDIYKILINDSLRNQSMAAGHNILTIGINKLEKNNTNINYRELPLKQRIQWMSERVLKIDNATIGSNEILQHIKLIESNKFNEWSEQNIQLDQHLNNINSRIIDILHGRHPQILQDAAKDLNIELPRPKTSIWKDFKNWVYEDPSEIQEKFFKKGIPIIDGYTLMLEDMLIHEGKNNRISDERRSNKEYQKEYQNFAKLVVKVFQDFQNKGKIPAQSQ